jgi:NADH:ubiquinone oxidoreductase subunit F (NADH-binding)
VLATSSVAAVEKEMLDDNLEMVKMSRVSYNFLHFQLLDLFVCHRGQVCRDGTDDSMNMLESRRQARVTKFLLLSLWLGWDVFYFIL